jgi:hypothetical protein
MQKPYFYASASQLEGDIVPKISIIGNSLCVLSGIVLILWLAKPIPEFVHMDLGDKLIVFGGACICFLIGIANRYDDRGSIFYPALGLLSLTMAPYFVHGIFGSQ